MGIFILQHGSVRVKVYGCNDKPETAIVNYFSMIGKGSDCEIVADNKGSLEFRKYCCSNVDKVRNLASKHTKAPDTYLKGLKLMKSAPKDGKYYVQYPFATKGTDDNGKKPIPIKFNPEELVALQPSKKCISFSTDFDFEKEAYDREHKRQEQMKKFRNKLCEPFVVRHYDNNKRGSDKGFANAGDAVNDYFKYVYKANKTPTSNAEILVTAEGSELLIDWCKKNTSKISSLATKYGLFADKYLEEIKCAKKLSPKEGTYEIFSPFVRRKSKKSPPRKVSASDKEIFDKYDIVIRHRNYNTWTRELLGCDSPDSAIKTYFYYVGKYEKEGLNAEILVNNKGSKAILMWCKSNKSKLVSMIKKADLSENFYLEGLESAKPLTVKSHAVCRPFVEVEY